MWWWKSTGFNYQSTFSQRPDLRGSDSERCAPGNTIANETFGRRHHNGSVISHACAQLRQREQRRNAAKNADAVNGELCPGRCTTGKETRPASGTTGEETRHSGFGGNLPISTRNETQSSSVGNHQTGYTFHCHKRIGNSQKQWVRLPLPPVKRIPFSSKHVGSFNKKRPTILPLQPSNNKQTDVPTDKPTHLPTVSKIEEFFERSAVTKVYNHQSMTAPINFDAAKYTLNLNKYSPKWDRAVCGIFEAKLLSIIFNLNKHSHIQSRVTKANLIFCPSILSTSSMVKIYWLAAHLQKILFLCLIFFKTVYISL